MDVNVSSRHVELTPALRGAATEKIGRLQRFLPGMERAEVHFTEQRNPRIADKDVCEVTMEGHGHHVRVKVAAADPFAAVDAAVDKLEHRLHRLKSKLVDRGHRRPLPAPGAVEEATEELVPAAPLPPIAEDPSLRIVRTKQFAMRPMAPDEAALQMDLLGHSFFFFRNAETGRSAVVYRRAAGDIGLIDEHG